MPASFVMTSFEYLTEGPPIPVQPASMISTAAPTAPTVPTLQEIGLEGFEVSSWLSMHTIAGTPEAIVHKLSEDIIEGMNTPEVRARLDKAGFVVATLPAREFGAKVRRERAEWEQTARVAGIQLDFKKE